MMKLSDAIRMGTFINHQGFGSMVDNDGATCALMAAIQAAGLKKQIKVIDACTEDERGRIMEPGNITVFSAPPAWGLELSVACPACLIPPRYQNLLYRVIPHLNDTHRWTREMIADWVEGIEIYMTASQLFMQAVDKLFLQAVDKMMREALAGPASLESALEAPVSQAIISETPACETTRQESVAV